MPKAAGSGRQSKSANRSMALSPLYGRPAAFNAQGGLLFCGFHKEREEKGKEKRQPNISKNNWRGWKKIHCPGEKFRLFAQEKMTKKPMGFFHQLIQPINGKLINQQKIEIEYK